MIKLKISGVFSDSKSPSAKKAILIIGLFSLSKLGNWSDCIEIAEYLREEHWAVYTASDKTNRIHRLIDIIWTVIRHHRSYSVAQIDVYSGNAFIWSEIASILLQTFGKPYILTLHGGNLPEFSKRSPRRVQRLLQHASFITVPSPYLFSRMKPFVDELYLLPSPLSLNRYQYIQRTSPQNQLIWLRSFHKIYNPEMAIRVMAILKNHAFKAYLSMYGSDKKDGSLQATQKLISEWNLGNSVTVNSSVPKSEVSVTLQSADIFLNTTNVDNTPVSVIEAMACGLCIISTNVGGIPDLLTDNYNALLVPANDANAMADAIVRILSEPDLASKLSQNARIKAMEFDKSIVLPQWQEIFTSIEKK